MKFNVVIDQDKDGVWIIECHEIKGCVSQGETKEEALESIKDAIITCLQVPCGERTLSGFRYRLEWE